jgi:membrane-bound ClpP family serine protease
VEFLIPAAIIFLGLALIAAEVYFIPGLNLAGIAGFLAILFGLGYMFAESGFTGGIMALILTGVIAGGMFYLMWQSGAWDRFVLATNLREDADTTLRESENRAKFLGRIGRAVTPLRPTGVAEIDGERVEVMTEGEFIASGSTIRIVAMDRRRYFVRLADVIPESSTSN